MKCPKCGIPMLRRTLKSVLHPEKLMTVDTCLHCGNMEKVNEESNENR